MVSIARRVKTATSKVFFGWWVVAAACALAALGSGSVFYGFSAFFNPMIEEFGWSRAATSGVFSLSRMEGGFEGVIVGPLIDRFGARKIAIGGVIACGAGFFALLLVNGNILTIYFIFGILISIGYNCFTQRAVMAAAAKWFIKKRSLALSFVISGSGIGGAVGIPVIAWLIANYSWRVASMATGAAIIVLGLPPAFMLRSTPEERGLLPDGEVPGKKVEATTESPAKRKRSEREDVDFTVREAVKTSAFWFYAFGLMARACVISAIVVHEIPYLTDMGIDYTAAAGILALMVFLSIPGRIIFGWLGDSYDKRILIFIACILQAIGIWIFIHATSLGMLYVFVVVYGMGYGGVMPPVRAIQGDLFGRKSYATLAGIANIFSSIGTVTAPLVAGYLYDVSHSYLIAFYSLMVLIVVAGVLWSLIRFPKPPARLATEAGSTGHSS